MSLPKIESKKARVSGSGSSCFGWEVTISSVLAEVFEFETTFPFFERTGTTIALAFISAAASEAALFAYSSFLSLSSCSAASYFFDLGRSNLVDMPFCLQKYNSVRTF